MRIAMTAAMSEAVRSHIRAFTHPITRIVDIAREFGALPVWVDWASFVAITPDGEIVVLDHDEESPNRRPATEITLLATALTEAAKRFPELAHVVPSRPLDAAECHSCRGAGQIAIGKQNFKCQCGGLGWIATDVKQLGMFVG